MTGTLGGSGSGAIDQLVILATSRMGTWSEDNSVQPVVVMRASEHERQETLHIVVFTSSLLQESVSIAQLVIS